MPSRLTQLKYSAFFIKSKIFVCFKPSLVSKSAAFFIKHKKAYFLKSDFLSGLFLVIPFSGFGGIYFILEHELSRFVLVYVRSEGYTCLPRNVQQSRPRLTAPFVEIWFRRLMSSAPHSVLFLFLTIKTLNNRKMFLTFHEAACSCDSSKAVDVFEIEFSTTERFSESASVMKWSEIKTKVISPTNHNATQTTLATNQELKQIHVPRVRRRKTIFSWGHEQVTNGFGFTSEKNSNHRA